MIDCAFAPFYVCPLCVWSRSCASSVNLTTACVLSLLTRTKQEGYTIDSEWVAKPLEDVIDDCWCQFILKEWGPLGYHHHETKQWCNEITQSGKDICKAVLIDVLQSSKILMCCSPAKLVMEERKKTHITPCDTEDIWVTLLLQSAAEFLLGFYWPFCAHYNFYLQVSLWFCSLSFCPAAKLRDFMFF